MRQYRARVAETADFLRKHLTSPPLVGLITGTGLGAGTGAIGVQMSFSYHEIPNFPASTVESHFGKLVLGSLAERPVIAMQGRFHLYEGYSPWEVTFPVRVMQALGIRALILSNAAGGLNPAFHPGDIMVLADHINLTGKNPLIGPNEDSWGERFPDMSRVYDPALSALAASAGETLGGRMRRGVYAGLNGPSLETPAEIRFLRTIGADAVGFSTVQEVIAGAHAGMRILALSTITNVHDPEAPAPASVAEIIACAGRAAPIVGGIIEEVVGHIDE
jgi:purine-nucleoside phosphorylase